MLTMSFKRGAITYRYSKEPMPNQKFARVALLIVGVILIFGGAWWLWSLRNLR